jgi:uncharacterized membrane protein (UPF0127 family)
MSGSAAKVKKTSGERFYLIFANTEAQRNLGLGGRKSLPENQGMFFIFDEPGDYSFWMKDMQFPIDIIWLDEHGVITHIEKNVAPETYPKTFFPGKKSLYVLETNSGYAEKNNLEEGYSIDFVKQMLDRNSSH